MRIARIAPVVAVALALAVAAPAHATTAYTIGGSDDFSYATSHCTYSGSPNPGTVSAVSLPTTGAPRTVTVSTSGTITDSSDSDDVTNVSAKAKVKASATPTSLHATSVVDAVIDPQGGSTECATSSTDISGGVTAQIEGTLTLTQPGWLTLSGAQHGSGVAGFYASVEESSGSETGIMLGYWIGDSVTGSEQVYEQPGDYEVTVNAIAQTDEPSSAQGYREADGTSTMSLTFSPGGTAAAPASGSAKSAVTLPSSVSCSSHKAKLKLTSGIKGAKSVSVAVNGKTKASKSHPAPGALSVSGIPATGAVKLTATVVGKSGAKTTVTRSYLGCG